MCIYVLHFFWGNVHKAHLFLRKVPTSLIPACEPPLFRTEDAFRFPFFNHSPKAPFHARHSLPKEIFVENAQDISGRQMCHHIKPDDLSECCQS